MYCRNGKRGRTPVTATFGEVVTCAAISCAVGEPKASLDPLPATKSTSWPFGDHTGSIPPARLLLTKAPPRASIEVVLGWWSETAAKLAQVKRWSLH